MSTEIRKRTGVNCCLLVVLTLQSSVPSLALPVIQPGARPERQERCIIVHANLSSVQATPGHIVSLLSQRQVQSEFTLQLPLKESYPREEVEGSPEGDGKVKIGGGASFVLCRGEWPHKPSPPNALKLYGAGNLKDSPNQPRSEEYQYAGLYLLLSSETLDEMLLMNNVSLTLTCSSYCYSIIYNNQSPRTFSHTRLLRRSAGNGYGSHDTHLTNSDATLVVAVVVAVVSLIVIIALVALCAGSSTNNRQETAGAITLQKSASDAPSSEVAVQSQPPKAVHVEVDIEMSSEPAVATNGSVREKAAATDRQQLSPSHPDSLNPPPMASPQREVGSDRESRSRTLSARSFDPLPEIPKLETAEDDKDQRSKESPPSRREGGGDDEDDEAGYAYARVGGAAVNGMDEAESDKEDKAVGDDVHQDSNLPPYGKVSHHVTKAKVRETEEYAEVKEVFRGPAAVIAANRGRSATDPVDPKEAGVDGVRDKRALTHTHMMPLPAVPTQPISVDDNEMYDSIPDDMRNTQVPLPQASAPAARPRPKERLYESMDEVEDTYESVPDNLKPDSPLAASPASPAHSPSKLPLPGSSTSPPLPPSSPVPKPQPKEPEKKGLEKTLSASQAEGDGKRRFSFFGRKKTASVSGVISKKKEKEKHEKHADKEHKDHHHVPHQPLPDVPTLSPVKSPPLPPIPANDDENDTMYDTPQLDFMSSPSRNSPGPPPPLSPSEVKAKSQSLPLSARGAGAAVFHGPRVNIPLPRVPEDSGQGMVVRERIMESPQRGEEDKPYDSVKVPTDMNGEEPYDTVRVMDGLENINEPNYDTVDKEEIFKAVAEAEGAQNEPGYDRVRQLEEVGSERQGEREKVPTPQPTEGDGSAVGVNGIRYGKVTRPLSPEEDIPGILPEHDEEGYAVVPEDFKMRKRALSASKVVQPQIKCESPETVNESIEELEEDTSPSEPTEPYATVDILTKKDRRNKDDHLATETSRERSTSPVPPPLPPVGDLGDVAGEFAQPPIPVQSDGIHELVSPDGSSSLKPPGSDDPPYAKVKSKDHPYAELDLGAGGELAKLAAQENKYDTKIGCDEVGADVSKETASNDKGLLYDTITDPEVSQEMVDDEAIGYNTVKDLQPKQEEASGYDTVIDSDKGRVEDGHSPLNQSGHEVSKLELAEPQQQLYDSLEPLEEETVEAAAGNLYDSLEEKQQPQQVQNGVSADTMEEERYEEIDDDRRLELIAKQKQWLQSKSS